MSRAQGNSWQEGEPVPDYRRHASTTWPILRVCRSRPYRGYSTKNRMSRRLPGARCSRRSKG
ncbi:hypothetical protein [Lysobacter gummosus]|uniref:hypothetical protein n=1 Tax=Lysobacter gummosus TaxID=262324 RepID=UPI003635EB98